MERFGMARSDLPDGYPDNVTLISDIYWRSPNEWPKPLIRDRHKERPAFLLEAFHKIGSRLDEDWNFTDCHWEPIFPELCESDIEFSNDDVDTKRKVITLIEMWDPDRRFPDVLGPDGRRDFRQIETTAADWHLARCIAHHFRERSEFAEPMFYYTAIEEFMQMVDAGLNTYSRHLKGGKYELIDPDNWLADVNVIADRFWFGRWTPDKPFDTGTQGTHAIFYETSGFEELLEKRRATDANLQETKVFWDALCRIDRNPATYPDVTFPKLVALLSQPNAFFPVDLGLKPSERRLRIIVSAKKGEGQVLSRIGRVGRPKRTP